jgi:hypothetical protein
MRDKGVGVGWQGAVMQQRIVQAGNTVVPALLAVESLGFAVEVSGGTAYARREQEEYAADDPVALLGLIRLVELRSWDWVASDSEIDETLRRYELG